MGDEDPRFLIEHLTRAARLAAPDLPQLAEGFPDAGTVGEIYEEAYLDVRRRRVADCKRKRSPA